MATAFLINTNFWPELTNIGESIDAATLAVSRSVHCVLFERKQNEIIWKFLKYSVPLYNTLVLV